MTILLLVRHGLHDEVGRVLSGRSEIALNDIGRDQARRTAAALASRSIGAVQTSPRRRALQTAEAIAQPRGIGVTNVAALDEIDFGTWSGRSFAELAADPAWNAWNASRATAPTPAGDTMAAVVRRLLDHLLSLRHDGEDVVCVSHCDVIRAIVAYCRGWDAGRMLSFDIDPCSVTTLALDRTGLQLVSVNETFA